MYDSSGHPHPSAQAVGRVPSLTLEKMGAVSVGQYGAFAPTNESNLLSLRFGWSILRSEYCILTLSMDFGCNFGSSPFLNPFEFFDEPIGS